MIYFSYSINTGQTNLALHLLHEHEITLSSVKANENQREISDVFFPSSTTPSMKRKSGDANSSFILFRQIVLWFCLDLLPFNTVEKKGFNAFWQYLNKALALPSRSTVSIGALDDLYLCCKNKLIEILTKSSSHGTVTCDGWTDSHNHISYFTYTYHFMENWQMKSVVLKTAAFPHPHTAERMKEDFESTLAEFNVLDKKVSVVTDGARAMKKAAELLNVFRLYCVGHITHLLVRVDLLMHDQMQPLRDLRSKMRKIHRKLIFRHEQLSAMHDESKQEKVLSLLEEHKDIGTHLHSLIVLFYKFNLLHFF